MATLPAPKNKAVQVTKLVLEKLIEGLGVDVAIAAATAYVPFLGTPVIRTLFRWGVEFLAGILDENLFAFAAKYIIRMQGSARKDEFNDSMLPIMAGSATDEEIKRARDAAAGVIQRGNR